MTETPEIAEARAALDSAIGRWLKVKAQYVDEDDGYDDHETALIQSSDPVMQGWVLVACYTSIELEREDATAYAYDCPAGQPAALSRGLAMSGVDRWSNA